MNLFFFGDSVCFGSGVSPHKAWVTRISAAVEKAFGDQFVVINSSINGNTTRMALDRMGYDVQAHGLVSMVLQFGLNDCNRWETDRGLPRVSPEAFRHNLVEIVHRACHFGAREVLMNTNHPTLKRRHDGELDDIYQQNNRHYNGIIREVAGLRDEIGLIDVEVTFDSLVGEGTPLCDLLLTDGVHLSVRGNDLYAELVAPPLLSSLERVAQRAARVSR